MKVSLFDEKKKIYIIHVYFQIATRLKTGACIYYGTINSFS